jgi:methyltransferase (TIGR00027 family)
VGRVADPVSTTRLPTRCDAGRRFPPDCKTARVSDRAASATAVLVCQGRAAADGRYAVGRFSDPVARQLLDRTELEVVDAVRSDQRPQSGAHGMAWEMVWRTGQTMVPRSIMIDDAIREHGASQLVVLGAGLDSRAWRMAELAGTTVFEVDHPASQRDKVRRLGALHPVAARVVPVAVDLTTEPLGPALEAAGFDHTAVTTWVWEGVVPYLPAKSVRSTVAQLGQLSALGSRLVVNYQAKSLPVPVMRAVMRVVFWAARQEDVLAREPWRSLWRPGQMQSLLADNGFHTTSDVDLLSGAAGLDLPGGNNRSLANGRVAVAVRR